MKTVFDVGRGVGDAVEPLQVGLVLKRIVSASEIMLFLNE